MATSTSTICQKEEKSNLTPIMVFPRYVFAPAITPPSSPVKKTPQKHITPERRESGLGEECIPDVQRALVYPTFLHKAYVTPVKGEGNNSFAEGFGLPACESTPCKDTTSGNAREYSTPYLTPDSTPGSRVSNLSCQSASPISTVNTTGYASASPHSSSVARTCIPESSATACKKNGRTTYTTEQVRILEKAFSQERYPETETIENLSRDINVPENKIKIWFQNKRARSKRQNVPLHVPVYMVTPPMSPVSPLQPIHPAAYSSYARMFHGSYSPTSPLPMSQLTIPRAGMYSYSLPMLPVPHFSNIHTNQSPPLYLPQSTTQCVYPRC